MAVPPNIRRQAARFLHLRKDKTKKVDLSEFEGETPRWFKALDGGTDDEKLTFLEELRLGVVVLRELESDAFNQLLEDIGKDEPGSDLSARIGNFSAERPQDFAVKVNTVLDEAKKKGLMEDITGKPSEDTKVTKYTDASGTLKREDLDDDRFNFNPDAGFTGVLKVQRVGKDGELQEDNFDIVVFDKGKPVSIILGDDTRGECRVANMADLLRQMRETGIEVTRSEQRAADVAPGLPPVAPIIPGTLQPPAAAVPEVVGSGSPLRPAQRMRRRRAPQTPIDEARGRIEAAEASAAEARAAAEAARAELAATRAALEAARAAAERDAAEAQRAAVEANTRAEFAEARAGEAFVHSAAADAELVALREESGAALSASADAISQVRSAATAASEVLAAALSSTSAGLEEAIAATAQAEAEAREARAEAIRAAAVLAATGVELAGARREAAEAAQRAETDLASAGTSLSAAQTTVAELVTRNAGLTVALEEAEARRDVAVSQEAERADLLKQAAAIERARLERELEGSNREKEELSRKIATFAKDVSARQRQVNEQAQYIGALTAEQSKLRAQAAETKREIDELKSKAEISKIEAETLLKAEGKRERIAKDLSRQSSHLGRLKKELTEAKKSVEEADTQKEALARDLEEQQAISVGLMAAIVVATVKLQELQAQLSMREFQLDTSNQAHLRTQVDEESRARDTISSVQDDELRLLLSAMTASLQAATAAADARRRISSVEDELIAAKATSADALAHASAAEVRATEAASRAVESAEAAGRAREELEALRSRAEEDSGLDAAALLWARSELEAAQAEVVRARDAAASASTRAEAMIASQGNELVKTIEALTGTTEKLRTTESSLESSEAALQQALVVVKVLERENARLSLELEAAEADLEDARIDVERARREEKESLGLSEQYSHELEQSISQSQKFAETIRGQKQEIARLESAQSKSKAQAAELDVAREALAGNEAARVALEARIAEQQDELKATEGRAKDTSSALADAEEKLRAAESQISEMREAAQKQRSETVESRAQAEVTARGGMVLQEELARTKLALEELTVRQAAGQELSSAQLRQLEALTSTLQTLTGEKAAAAGRLRELTSNLDDVHALIRGRESESDRLRREAKVAADNGARLTAHMVELEDREAGLEKEIKSLKEQLETRGLAEVESIEKLLRQKWIEQESLEREKLILAGELARSTLVGSAAQAKLLASEEAKTRQKIVDEEARRMDAIGKVFNVSTREVSKAESTRQELERMQHEVDKARAELSELTAHQAAGQELNAKQQAEAEARRAISSAEKDSFALLEAELQKRLSEQALADKSREIEQMRGRLEQAPSAEESEGMRDKIRALELDVRVLKETNRRAMADIARERRILALRKEGLDDLESDTISVYAALSVKEEMYRTLLDTHRGTAIERDRLKTELEGVRSEMRALETEHEGLQEHLSRAGSLGEEVVALLKEEQGKNAQMQEDNKKLEARGQELSSEIADLQRQIEHTRADAGRVSGTAREGVVGSEARERGSVSETEAAERESIRLNFQIGIQDKELALLKEDIRSKDEQLAEFEVRAQELEGVMSRNREQETALAELRTEIEKVSREKTTAQAEAERAQGALKRLTAEIEKVRVALNPNVELLRALDAEKEQVASLSKNMEEIIVAAEVLNRKVEDLRAQIRDMGEGSSKERAAARLELTKALAGQEKLGREKIILERELAVATVAIELTQDKLLKAEEARAKTRSRSAELEKQLRELHAERAEALAKLKTDLERAHLDKEHETSIRHAEELVRLEIDVQSAIAGKDGLSERIRALEESLAESRIQSTNERAALEDRIKELAHKLEETLRLNEKLASSARGAISEQIASMKAELEEAHADLSRYKAKGAKVAPPTPKKQMVEMEVQTDLTMEDKLEEQQASMEASVAELGKVKTEVLALQGKGVSDVRIISELRERVGVLIKENAAKIAEARELGASLEAQGAAFKAKEKELRGSKYQLEKEMAQTKKSLEDQRERTREADTEVRQLKITEASLRGALAKRPAEEDVEKLREELRRHEEGRVPQEKGIYGGRGMSREKEQGYLAEIRRLEEQLEVEPSVLAELSVLKVANERLSDARMSLNRELEDTKTELEALKETIDKRLEEQAISIEMRHDAEYLREMEKKGIPADPARKARLEARKAMGHIRARSPSPKPPTTDARGRPLGPARRPRTKPFSFE